MNKKGFNMGFALFVFVTIIIAYTIYFMNSSPEEQANILYGQKNSQMICPHCNKVGHIHTKNVEQKKGISGGKATGAILTGGISLLATGLSRKENHTQAHCTNCNNTWYF